MFCGKCGYFINPGESFCTRCGYAVNTSSQKSNNMYQSAGYDQNQNYVQPPISNANMNANQNSPMLPTNHGGYIQKEIEIPAVVASIMFFAMTLLYAFISVMGYFDKKYIFETLDQGIVLSYWGITLLMLLTGIGNINIYKDQVRMRLRIISGGIVFLLDGGAIFALYMISLYGKGTGWDVFLFGEIISIHGRIAPVMIIFGVVLLILGFCVHGSKQNVYH